jgi:hypothetical protein
MVLLQVMMMVICHLHPISTVLNMLVEACIGGDKQLVQSQVLTLFLKWVMHTPDYLIFMRWQKNGINNSLYLNKVPYI